LYLTAIRAAASRAELICIGCGCYAAAMDQAGNDESCGDDVNARRLVALDGIFGKREKLLYFGIPFGLGGDPAIAIYSNYLPGRTVYCTSEMTGGWGSGQLPGEFGEYEFVIVLPNGSELGPGVYSEEASTKGWSGVLLCGFCKHSCETVVGHGDTSGPLPEAFAPHTAILFAQLAGGRVRFEFGGRRYGLMLMMSITDAEYRFAREHSGALLIKKLREAGAFPVTDPSRKCVVG